MANLSASELAGMRSAISELLPDSASILSPTSTADGMGGVTVTWGTASTVACRLDVIQGREQISGGALQPFTSYKLSLPYDTTITAANRVIISSTTYAVTAVNSGQSWSAVVRCELEKV